MADQEERTISINGYELTFYPGFASRCTVRDADGTEHELYRQTETYRLPSGQTRPRNKHRVRLKGGKRKQDVSLEITDPELRVKSITIELYDEDHEVGSGTDSATGDTISLLNNPVICPPHCAT